MKIIDNKKDYYDYLSGIYGIDDLVVYDRRGSIPSIDIVDKYRGGLDTSIDPFFSKRILDFDRWSNYDRPLSSYDQLSKKYYSYSDFYIVVEAGYAHWYIKVERYRLKKEDPITLKYTGMSEEDYWKNRRASINTSFKWRLKSFDEEHHKALKKISNAPLSIAFYNFRSNSWSERTTPLVYENPILKDIPGIPGAVDPVWIWQNLYDYISSQKDKPIVDTRTDVQHLESAGFDKKTSFRNM